MNQSSVLSCYKIVQDTDPFLSQIEATYISSFPLAERRDFSLVKKLISFEPMFNVEVLLCNGLYVGFITSWNFEDFSYVEHFAIDESQRNGGIGGKALSAFISGLSRPVVLEVESPSDDMSIRRIGFYKRQGFVLNEQEYKQPPYRPGESWFPMLLMTHGPIDLSIHFDRVKNMIHKHVYGVEII